MITKKTVIVLMISIALFGALGIGIAQYYEGNNAQGDFIELKYSLPQDYHLYLLTLPAIQQVSIKEGYTLIIFNSKISEAQLTEAKEAVKVIDFTLQQNKLRYSMGKETKLPFCLKDIVTGELVGYYSIQGEMKGIINDPECLS